MTSAKKSWPTKSGSGRLTRRSFLRSTLLSLIVAGVGTSRASLGESEAEPCAEPHWFRFVINNRQQAARLGWAYLDAHPQFRDCDILLRHIQRSLQNLNASEFATADDVGRTSDSLRQLVSTEFAGDDVVSVSGWLLSQTEARLYALAALLQ